MAQDKGAKSAGAKGKAAAAGSAPQSNVLLLAAVCVGAVGVAAYYLLAQRSGADRAILQPLKAKRLTDLEQFSPAYKDEMLWGSYRSGLYFGMRTRSPKGLLAGLMWFDPHSYDTLAQQRVRHQASQGDGLQQYGWVRHDGRSWGRQVLVDNPYNISITMVKNAGEDSGTGGDWAVRIETSKSASASEQQPGVSKRKSISLVFYLMDEDKPSSPWSLLPEGEPDSLREGMQLMTGGNAVVGDFSLHLKETSAPKKRAARLNYLSLPLAESGSEYRLTLPYLLLSIIYENMQRNPPTSSKDINLELPNGAVTGADFAMFQITIPVGGSVDLVYLSHKGGWGASSRDSESTQERMDALSGHSLTRLMQHRETEFEQKFKQTFPSVSSDPITTDNDSSEVAKAALSNLLGSMGYFYGQSKVRVPWQPEPALYWPAALFTAVPSRSFFPRGFLWDEGFHQLLVARWDPLLSRDVLAHWLDLMNAQGWIPREQILGAEAEQRVPAEFVVQNPSHANPPSLFLPIANLAAQLASSEGGSDSGEVRAFLHTAWPRLEAWYHWLNTTQQGPTPGSYRWRGRNDSTDRELNPKTLTSGLDDYPRASHPTQDERHLDLRCWMALVSQAMASIARSLKLQPAVIAKYEATEHLLSDMSLLDSHHWDNTRSQYLDWGLHTEAVRLVKTVRGHQQGPVEEVMVREVDEPPTLRYVPHYGYVSLFPLLMRVLPADSPRLGAVLGQLRDDTRLWSPYGLRSLSADSSLHKKYNTEHDPPYWRGQIWININYLALSALRHYSRQQGPYQELATQLETDLRTAVTQLIVRQYGSQGYIYEQYDDSTGEGKSSHPFTGWSALITLIATGSY